MIRIEELVAVHNRDEIMSVAQVNNVMRITRKHVDTLNSNHNVNSHSSPALFAVLCMQKSIALNLVSATMLPLNIKPSFWINPFRKRLINYKNLLYY